ncbi:unnamed protein product [Merluccius merluccius]
MNLNSTLMELAVDLSHGDNIAFAQNENLSSHGAALLCNWQERGGREIEEEIQEESRLVEKGAGERREHEMRTRKNKRREEMRAEEKRIEGEPACLACLPANPPAYSLSLPRYLAPVNHTALPSPSVSSPWEVHCNKSVNGHVPATLVSCASVHR